MHPDYRDCKAVEWYGRDGLQLYDMMRHAQPGEDVVLLHGNVEPRYELHGGAPLLAHGTRAEYYSPSCRKVGNVKRSRERRSEKN